MYGLPISVKECFFVKGYDATAGLARYIDSPAEEDGGMVKVSFHFCQEKINNAIPSNGPGHNALKVTVNRKRQKTRI